MRRAETEAVRNQPASWSLQLPKAVRMPSSHLVARTEVRERGRQRPCRPPAPAVRRAVPYRPDVPSPVPAKPHRRRSDERRVPCHDAVSPLEPHDLVEVHAQVPPAYASRFQTSGPDLTDDELMVAVPPLRETGNRKLVRLLGFTHGSDSRSSSGFDTRRIAAPSSLCRRGSASGSRSPARPAPAIRFRRVRVRLGGP